MMRAAVLAVLLGATAVSAFPIETSLRPVARPGSADGQVLVATDALASVLRPKARPAAEKSTVVAVVAPEEHEVAPEAVAAEAIEVASATFVLPQALRPIPRPKAVTEKAIQRRQMQQRGAVCGDLSIQGDDIGVVLASTFGCGVDSAVKVKSVSGIALSQPSTMDCQTAKALKNWVDNGLRPAVGSKGGGVSKIQVMGHYVCRPRNNQAGNRISEHGRGRAIDIGGFTLKDGTKISVLKDWRTKSNGKILKAAYAKACGTFGTTLGPNANRYHQDHFHFDTARYRSGSYCK